MRRDDPRHGTPAGYRTHCREGKKPCRPCREARRTERQRIRRERLNRGSASPLCGGMTKAGTRCGNRSLSGGSLCRVHSVYGSGMTRSDSRHGTTAGYQAHYTAGQKPCEACREAHRTKARARYQAKRARGYTTAQPCSVCGQGFKIHGHPFCVECRESVLRARIKHGTMSGAHGHAHLGEAPCEPCRLARSVYFRTAYAESEDRRTSILRRSRRATFALALLDRLEVEGALSVPDDIAVPSPAEQPVRRKKVVA